MAKTRRNRAKQSGASRTQQRGAGYVTSQQFFDPEVLPPSAGAFAPVMSTAPTAYEIRPILAATVQNGGRTRRSTRRTRGGFSPSVMGGFIPNAQAAIVPAALYGLYHVFVPKKTSGGRNTRRNRSSKSRRV